MDRQPNLGLATTEQLIAELHARARVSRVNGEDWPNYRTVDEPVDPRGIVRDGAITAHGGWVTRKASEFCCAGVGGGETCHRREDAHVHTHGGPGGHTFTPCEETR